MAFKDAMFFMPAVEGIGVPSWFHDYIGSLATSLDNAFYNIGEWTSDPSQTTIEVQDAGGLTLSEISDYLPISGTLRLFHGSWATAATIRGWVICDGSNGTPKIHPALGDASPIQRMVRATAYGANSGTTAGAECHSHTTCVTSGAAGGHGHNDNLSIDYECGHTHCVCGNTCCDGDHSHGLGAGCTDINFHCHDFGTLYTAQCAKFCQNCCDGGNHCFSCSDHSHNVCGETDNCDACGNGHDHPLCGNSCCDACHQHEIAITSEAGCCHTHVLSGDICVAANHSHTIGCQVTDSVALLPQVIDVIWLMKL